MKYLSFECDVCGKSRKLRYKISKARELNYCPAKWRLFGTPNELKHGQMAMVCCDCVKKITIKTTASERDQGYYP